MTSETPSRTKVVLIVDDVPDIRSLLETGIKVYDSSFRVMQAASSEEALRILGEQRVDAVIMDVNLVGESGAALAADIHEKFPQLPKAFLTAYDRSVTHEHAEELGMEVWTKPIEMRRLVGCINRLLANKPTPCGKIDRSRERVTPVSMPEILRKVASSLLLIDLIFAGGFICFF